MPLDRIIATAIAIVDEQGADALSMRTLAHRLDSGTATLYRHFNSRAQLIAHIVDAVLGEIDLDVAEPSDASWRDVCEHAADHMFNVLVRHPNVAPLLLGQIPNGPNAAAGRELLIATLLQAGFSPAIAAQAYATLSRYVLGFAIQAHQPDADAAQYHSQQLDLESLPATAAVAEHLPVPIAREFAFGLDLILNGLAQQLDRPRR